MVIIGVMAVDPIGVIGINNRLPWHYPNELAHFRQVTDKQVIVMGRNTFETMPQSILKDRISVVFSRNKLSFYYNRGIKYRGIKYTTVSSMEEFLSIQNSWNCSKIFVVGGAQIAHLFLEYNLISEFIMTEIHKPYKGDIYFNSTFLERWNKTIVIKAESYTIWRLIYAS